MKTRQEVIKRQRKAYARAAKKEKGRIIDGVCAATGLSRDRAARLLRAKQSREKAVPGKRGRKPKYKSPVMLKLLERLWAQMDCVCGKRLCAGLEGMIDALRRNGELNAPQWATEQVPEMSPSTADRLLKGIRSRTELRGRSTTKPGSLRKKDIPIRVGNQWDENMPGYMEMDLVAHCGETTAGEYINTLDMTDVYSGWTETRAVVNKAQRHVFEAIKRIRGQLPFPLLGLDSDNGGEFINQELYRYCLREKLVFTRSRPYHKNDNCYVEQKNYTMVRKQVGYARYEGEETVELLNRFYMLLRLYSNFFLPSVKLIAKERIGPKIVKKYDAPMTPYARLAGSPHLTQEGKAALHAQFATLNPAALKREMAQLLTQIQSSARRPTP